VCVCVVCVCVCVCVGAVVVTEAEFANSKVEPAVMELLARVQAVNACSHVRTAPPARQCIYISNISDSGQQIT
jgi:hypothetical protein